MGVRQHHTVLRVSAVLLICVVLAGCQTIQFERPQVTSASDWVTDGQNDERSRAFDAQVDVPLELAWKYSANAGFGSSSPLILQDRVLVGNRKGEIHTIEVATGRGRGFKQMGETVDGSPLIHDGTLYVPVAWGKHVLVAFDLSKGVNRWRARGVPFATALIGHGDTVVGVDLEGTLRAFSALDGDESWSIELAPFTTFKASPVRISDSDILLVDVDGVMYRVNLDKQSIVWQKEMGLPVYQTPAVVEEHMVISTTRGSVHMLNVEDGSERWVWRGESHVRMGAPAFGSKSVLVGGTDGIVRALNVDNGSETWAVEFTDVIAAAPLIAGETAFVGTLGEELFALNSISGKIVWQTTVDGRIKSAMATTEGGLVVLAEPKWVLYYRPDSQEGDESLASDERPSGGKR